MTHHSESKRLSIRPWQVWFSLLAFLIIAGAGLFIFFRSSQKSAAEPLATANTSETDPLPGAQAPAAGPPRLAGQVLIWHGWDPLEAEALDHALSLLVAANPDLQVRLKAFDFGELRAQFETAAAQSAGPDILIGPHTWIAPLAEAELIQAIDLTANSVEAYARPAVDALRYNDRLYGRPESVKSVALLYRTDLVAPPATLDDLLNSAAAGGVIALPTDFYRAFWGIQAFGGRLFDENGRAALGQGGFAAWLDWLAAAGQAPGMVLGDDAFWLTSLFKSSQAAYIVDGPWALADLRQAVGSENVGVAPLPAGPAGPAGPLLEVEAIMLNATVSPEQADLAQQVASYLAGAKAQTVLMAEAGHIPANLNVDTSRNPVMAGFVAQAANAVPLPAPTDMESVWGPGANAYARVLHGGLSGSDAATEASTLIDLARGYASTPPADALAAGPATVPDCGGSGQVTLWHAWDEVESAALAQIVADFVSECPDVAVQAVAIRFDRLRDRFDTAVKAGRGPDLLLAPGEWAGELAQAGQIQDISSLVDAQTLQRFPPAALDALRDQEGLYGLPASLQLVALFYNTALVDGPAATLDELLAQAAQGKTVALNSGFYHLFWGVRAFGGRLFDDRGRVMLDKGGFADWLDWLGEAQNAPGVVLDDDYSRLKNMFAKGEAAYYIDAPWVLDEFLTALGNDKVAVAPLPAGPAGPAGPFLSVEGFMINQAVDEKQSRMALAFAHYATDVPAQSLLMRTAGHIPANLAVDVQDDPAIAGFVAQAMTAVPLPGGRQMDAVWTPAGDAIAKVLAGALDGATAASEATTLINQAGLR